MLLYCFNSKIASLFEKFQLFVFTFPWLVEEAAVRQNDGHLCLATAFGKEVLHRRILAKERKVRLNCIQEWKLPIPKAFNRFRGSHLPPLPLEFKASNS
ncbi:hypothetical protein CEXT_419531 [Caerostris extrusa]|uniref:Uncharacterized protein n=1 Tax=Caerostris extrusa TaxID=172846 RepID=A0AAV4N7T0_CAEEX|nr:hypothetical protein CEXT_419531 [Caerostris extrusa]